jgi:hypothetical protein
VFKFVEKSAVEIETEYCSSTAGAL